MPTFNFKTTHKTICCFLAFIALSTTSAFGFLSDTNYFSFTGWNHDQVMSSGGQTFENIWNGIDVTVTANGPFDFATGFGGGWINTGGHSMLASHSLKFTFSESLPLLVKTETVDSEETLSVFAAGGQQYYHHSGAAPTEVMMPGGIQLQGNGTGRTDDGASSGEVFSPNAGTTITVSHQSLEENKFERIQIGTMAVPEPHAISLLTIGAVALLGRRRRR